MKWSFSWSSLLQAPEERAGSTAITDLGMIYGLSKVAGEYWCWYYFKKHGVDVRSIGYPGLIRYHPAEGCGTTDYAVCIFYGPLRNAHYTDS